MEKIITINKLDFNATFNVYLKFSDATVYTDTYLRTGYLLADSLCASAALDPANPSAINVLGPVPYTIITDLEYLTDPV